MNEMVISKRTRIKVSAERKRDTFSHLSTFPTATLISSRPTFTAPPPCKNCKERKVFLAEREFFFKQVVVRGQGLSCGYRVPYSTGGGEEVKPSKGSSPWWEGII